MSNKTILTRDEQKESDCWDLTTLYKTDKDWEQALVDMSELAKKIANHKGTFQQNPFIVLKMYAELHQIQEQAANYAFLKTAEDGGNSTAQEKLGKFMMISSQAEELISFFTPELQSIPDSEMEKIINDDECTEFRIFLQKLLRYKPYILSEKEERLFALQTESAQTPSNAFSQLTNVDFIFPDIKTKDGMLPLSQSTFSTLLQNPDRNVRKTAYKEFYKVYDTHKNTLATLLTGSIQQNVYQARARGYESVQSMELFSDNIPLEVYDQLIETIHANLSPLHKYYSLLKKSLGVEDLHHYDVYMPLTKDVTFHTSYDDAVDILHEAFAPLGSEYTNTLCKGLKNGWVDRYENKGKRSGAFSSGSYTSYPYILTNYKEDNIRDLFTIAHEGGHSMHTYYSAKSNPFMHYNYTIFEAEVASTFNEQLLFTYLLKNTKDEQKKQYLLCSRASDILATLYRQTMFAEFELITHKNIEEGKPLTTDSIREIYQNLLTLYFGSEMNFEPESNIECLRIPHFYNAFYVYKYATGISAALSLAKRVTEGGTQERDDYFSFLKSGGSKYPLESLLKAGVDMRQAKPTQDAILTFSKLVDLI